MNETQERRITPMTMIFGVLSALYLVYVIQYGWNHILANVVGVQYISYWQTFSLLLLARLPFTSYVAQLGCIAQKMHVEYNYTPLFTFSCAAVSHFIFYLNS